MDLFSKFIAMLTVLFSGLFMSHATEPVIVQPSQVEIIFGGDMLFDRTIRTTIEEKGGDYIFSCIDPAADGPAPFQAQHPLGQYR